MRTRRTFVGGMATALGMLGGCRSTGDAGDDGTATDATPGGTAAETTSAGTDRTTSTTDTAGGDGGESVTPYSPTVPYDDWFGPEMASTRSDLDGDVDGGDVLDFRTVEVGSLLANGDAPEWWRSRWTEPTYSSRTGVELQFGADAVDRWFHDPQTTFTIVTGSLDPSTVEKGLPDAASVQGTHGDHDLYTVPDTRGQTELHEAYAAGTDSFVAAREAPDPDVALSLVRRTLDTGVGDRDRFSETSDTFAGVVAQLGSGVFVTASLDGSTGHGVRLRFSGSSVQRRSVVAYDSAATAADEYATSEERIAQMRTSTPAGDGPRTVRTKFAPYERVERSRNGRFVVIDGTLPLAELHSIDMRIP